ncbi:MAG: acetyltransferase [Granulosicoccus sp.]
MTYIDVFNGDADGICSLHQLRLAEPRDSLLITGVKRDISLVKQVRASRDDQVTVLDVSFDKNRDAVQRLLDSGIAVRYFDHHFAGDIPDSTNLDDHIDTAATTCTGLIVNKYLNGMHLLWAVTAAFGDNLLDVAKEAAAPLNLSDEQLGVLLNLGTLLNYNGYGQSLDDLHFAPAELYKKLRPYADPFEFVAQDEAFSQLSDGYTQDRAQADSIEPMQADDTAAVYRFPDEAFARRISGVLANELAQKNPHRAHALLTNIGTEACLVSVRAPLNNRTGADELCRQFDTGGGRKAAAGINSLPVKDIPRFCDALKAQYS